MLLYPVLFNGLLIVLDIVIERISDLIIGIEKNFISVTKSNQIVYQIVPDALWKQWLIDIVV